MGDPEAILFHVERTSLGMAYGIVVSKARLPIEPDMFATDPQQQLRMAVKAQIRRSPRQGSAVKSLCAA